MNRHPQFRSTPGWAGVCHDCGRRSHPSVLLLPLLLACDRPQIQRLDFGGYSAVAFERAATKVDTITLPPAGIFLRPPAPIVDTVVDSLYCVGSPCRWEKTPAVRGVSITRSTSIIARRDTFRFGATAEPAGSDSIVWWASAGRIGREGKFTAPDSGTRATIVARGFRSGLADTVVVSIAADGTRAAGVGVGAWHVPPDSVGHAGFPYTGGTVNADSRLAAQLPKFRAAGSRVAVSILRKKLLDGSGRLSVAAAQADVATWPDLGPYVGDGTVYCVLVGDDIGWAGSYGGEVPPLVRWDSVARVIRVRWPEARTCIRATAVQLAGRRSWLWLTHYWAQFHARHDDILSWRDENLRVGREIGLCPVFGLNSLSGGTGESGVPGERSGTWQMGGAEVERYARAILPHTPFLYAWRWDPDFDTRAEIRSAMWRVRAVADSIAAVRCP